MRNVLDATLQIVVREGVEAVSFGIVAQRAGVSRTTLYRRWPTTSALVRAAVLDPPGADPATHDTGTVRGDLLAFARRHVERREAGAPACPARHAAPGEPELGVLVRLADDHIRRPVVLAVERAVARGELPPGTDARLVATPIVATVLHGSARGIEFVDVERVIELVLAGARSGAAVLPGRGADAVTAAPRSPGR